MLHPEVLIRMRKTAKHAPKTTVQRGVLIVYSPIDLAPPKERVWIAHD